MANLQAFKQDVLPHRVGTVAALVGFIETGLSEYIIQRVGVVTQEAGGFDTVFIMLAGLFTFGVILSLFVLRPRWLTVR